MARLARLFSLGNTPTTCSCISPEHLPCGLSEEACRQHNVKLFVLPPKNPKPSDHAKRMQRTFKGEFYTQPLPSRIPELQRELNAYLDYYNRQRPHRALNALAPLEFLAMMQGESVPEESQM